MPQNNYTIHIHISIKMNYYMKQTTTAHTALIYTLQTLYYTLYKYYLYTEQQKKLTTDTCSCNSFSDVYILLITVLLTEYL